MITQKTTLPETKSKILKHFFKSPAFAPSEFHLFSRLKKFQGGKRFENYEDFKKLLLLILNVLAAEEFDNGFEKLVKKRR